MTTRSKKMVTTRKKKRVVKRGRATKRAIVRKMMKRVIVIAKKMIIARTLLKTAGKSITLRKSTIFWMSQRKLKPMRRRNQHRGRIRK